MAVWDLNPEGAEETATLCRQRFGVTADWSVIDVADTAAVEAGVPRAAAALGTLGGFVHAAGIGGAMSVDYIDDELWGRTLDVNLRAAVMISPACCSSRSARPARARPSC